MITQGAGPTLHTGGLGSFSQSTAGSDLIQAQRQEPHPKTTKCDPKKTDKTMYICIYTYAGVERITLQGVKQFNFSFFQCLTHLSTQHLTAKGSSGIIEFSIPKIWFQTFKKQVKDTCTWSSIWMHKYYWQHKPWSPTIRYRFTQNIQWKQWCSKGDL